MARFDLIDEEWGIPVAALELVVCAVGWRFLSGLFVASWANTAPRNVDYCRGVLMRNVWPQI